MRFKIKIMSNVGQNIIHAIRTDIFNHLQELPFSYYDDRPHGKIQVRVVNYVNSLSDLLSNGIVNTITDLCNLIFIILFMLFCDTRLTLVCLCGLPALALVIVFIKKRQRKAWQIQSNKQSNLNAYIAESHRQRQHAHGHDSPHVLVGDVDVHYPLEEDGHQHGSRGGAEHQDDDACHFCFVRGDIGSQTFQLSDVKAVFQLLPS